LVFHHANIGNVDAVIPIMAGMKRKSKERLDAVIHILEEEENEFCIGYKKSAHNEVAGNGYLGLNLYVAQCPILHTTQQQGGRKRGLQI